MSDELIQPMSARRQLRLAIVAKLDEMQGIYLASPGDWPTPGEKLPALLVSAPSEQKTSINRGNVPEFNTTIQIVVQGQVDGATAEQAQDRIEDLAYRVEEAILKGYWINRMVQQFATIQTDVECTAEGKRHLAGFRMTLGCETFESFDPTVDVPQGTTWPPADPKVVPLESIGIHVDTTAPFDATGTYPNPPFPDAVLPAPRTSGPDGRDEGALDIQLPQ